jgi:bifunctional ADP-heptose synthase (sugar kinase/adenylyltransferase)
LKTLSRLYTLADLVQQRQEWRRQGKTVVFTNGCYDLLHPGHIRTLEAARSLGDVLILALNSDAGTRSKRWTR